MPYNSYSLDMEKIRLNAPMGATCFAPAPEWVIAFYFKIINDTVYIYDIQKTWQKIDGTIQDLILDGALPLTYEPKSWEQIFN